MKKLFALLIVVVMLVACALTGSAAISASEKKIVDALSEEITMASGTVVALPDRYINQAEDYLTKADLTDAQVTEILGYIEGARKVVADSEAASLSEEEAAVKNEVVKYAKEAAKVINAELKVTKLDVAGTKGEVTANYKVSLVFNANSTVEGYTEGTVIELSLSNDEITQTGAEGNMTATVIGSVLVMAAVAFVVVASRKKVSSK